MLANYALAAWKNHHPQAYNQNKDGLDECLAWLDTAATEFDNETGFHLKRYNYLVREDSITHVLDFEPRPDVPWINSALMVDAGYKYFQTGDEELEFLWGKDMTFRIKITV